ncbi:hypothetical protein QM012_007172 [Aureobasidium pullulans]|uniref:BTB domain-containing protein n=1 Tax=Aureobasidium pullulans TaxID=5580 RepID=A0ABR0TNL5_AURPU
MSFKIEIPTGDAVIFVSTERRYKMHSTQLIQASGCFADLLSTAGPALSREGVRAGLRYLLVLQDFDEATNRPIQPVFRRIPVDNNGRAQKKFSLMHESDKSTRFRSSLFSDYDRLIRTFANQSVSLDDKSIDTLLPDSLGLIEVAEKLDAVSMIAKIIENHLLAKGQDIFKAISASPVIWIDVAFRIQSKVLFIEALIHLTGKYNALSATPPDETFVKKYPRARSILDQLTPDLRDLLERKHTVLTQICQTVERSVSTHYPPGIQKSSVTGQAKTDPIGRIDYAKDVFTWVGVSLYRHWWGQMIAGDSTHNNKFGGHDIYTRLFNGGQSYLTREVQSGFHQHFPMSTKGQKILQNNVDIIKAGVTKIVTPLMKNESQLDITKFPVKWLTCTVVNGADYLWDPVVEPEVESEQGSEQEAEEDFQAQLVSVKSRRKRRADEAGFSVAPVGRGKGKERAIEPFIEEEDLDYNGDEDAEGEEG